MSKDKQKLKTWEDEFQEIQDLLFDHQSAEAFERGMALAKNPNAPRYYQVQGCIIAAYAEPGYHEAERLHNSAYLLFYGWKMRYNGQIVDEETQKIFEEVEEQLQELGRNIVPVNPNPAIADAATPTIAASPKIAALEDVTLSASTINMLLKTLADTPASTSTPARQVAASETSVEVGNPVIPTAIPLRLRSPTAQINNDVRHSLRLSTILRDNEWHDDPSIDLDLTNLGQHERPNRPKEDAKSDALDLHPSFDSGRAHPGQSECLTQPQNEVEAEVFDPFLSSPDAQDSVQPSQHQRKPDQAGPKLGKSSSSM